MLRQAGHAVLGVEADDPTEASASTTAPSSPTPRPSCGARINPRWMRDGVTMVDPAAHLHRHDGRARARRPAAARHDPRGAHRRSAPGSVIGPDTPARRHRRRHGARWCARPSPASRRSATTRPSGPTSSLRPGTRLAARRARRHVRRDQELRDRRGREGAAPLLHGRRRDRAARQHRRRHHHRQLRRPRTSTARRSAPTSRTGSNTVLVAPVEVGDGAYTGAGVGREPRRAAGRARQGRAGHASRRAGSRSARMRAERATAGGGRELMELRLQEEAHALRGHGQPRALAGDRRVPQRAARRRQAVDASPTASSTAATARASAAPTCSCCRATASRSTTASWSS